MSKVYTKATEILHEAFNKIEIGSKFTYAYLFELAYANTDYIGKRYKDKVSSFISTQQKIGIKAIEKTNEYSTKGKRRMIFKKISNIIKYDRIAIKDVPPAFYHFLKVWNTIRDDCYITPAGFKSQANNQTKLINEFLNQLYKNDFAVKFTNPVKYQKIGTVTVEMMESNFIIFRNVKRKDQGTSIKQEIPVVEKSPITEKVDEVTASEIGSAIVGELLKMTNKINTLTQDNINLKKIINNMNITLKSVNSRNVNLNKIIALKDDEIKKLKNQMEKVKLVPVEKSFNISDLISGRAPFFKG